MLCDMSVTIFQSQSDSSTWLLAAVLDPATPSPASTPLARCGDSHLEAQCSEAEAIGSPDRAIMSPGLVRVTE